MTVSPLDFPRRNEIWWVSLDRTASGTELAAAGKKRPALVVSIDEINHDRGAVTVALMTEYPGPTCDKSLKHRVNDFDYRQDQVPRVVSVLHPPYDNGRPHNSGHGYKIESHPGIWNRNIVNCGQLFTLPVPAKRSDSDAIDWHGARARLEHPLAIESVASALQALLGSSIGLNYTSMPGLTYEPPVRPLQFQAGDILQLNLPQQPNRRCLVVSSPSIDFLREHLWKGNGAPPLGREAEPPPWPLGHITVVPISARQLRHDDPTSVDITIANRTYWILCADLYTVDWRARALAPQRIATLDDNLMSRVRRALRLSLGLPVNANPAEPCP